MVPRAVLMKYGLVSLNTARQRVNTVKDKNVNTAKPKAVVNAVKGNNVNAIKASACWGNPQKDLQDQGVIDSGCSRHMTRNISYLTDYKEIDGGYVAFGGNPKGGKITGIVAKRRNRTLIKAARTMLADSKLPTTFWAEAVNTDHIGKFDGKVDEGFFIGYSLNSKAFRVFNSRTRIVEENLHIRFSESTPNVVGYGPNWVFDINALTRTMNYEPIVAGTQSNGFAADPPYSQDPKSSHDDGSKSSSDDGKKVIVKVNAVGGKTSIKLPFDPNMHALEDYSIFDFSRNDEDDGAESDINNLDTTIKEEPKKVIHALKDPSWIEAIQEELLQFKLQKVCTLVDLPNGKRAIGTKWVFRNKKDERGIMIRNKARLIAQGYTQEEGIDYDEVFDPVAKIEAIRLFLAYASFKDFMVYQIDVKSAFLYGKIEEEMYVCQPPRFEDPDFLDRVYKVEKALYGLHQAPRAWYETLLTYLLDNGFQRGKIDKTLFIKRHKGDILLVQVYVDDIIFGSTKKELCNAFEKLMHEKFQMSFMGELTFFLGLQVQQKKDGIFISQDKYVVEILKKFGFTEVKTASTPMETQKPLLKDKDGEEVDVHMYRPMIGSLMYLTSSRPDIMFAVCACVRYQVNPKVSHLHVVKRIFRYLKGQPKLGLWYLKDSPFDLVAYTERDYARVSLDRKSTTGVDGKKIIVTKSTVRRDIQLEDAEGTSPSGPTYIVANEVVHKELGDSLVRAATTTSSLEAEQDSGNITKTRSKATPNESSSLGTTSGGGPKCQETIGDTIAQTRFENVSKHSNDSLLARGNTLRSDEVSLKLKELMELCTNLQQRALDLEKTKTTQQNKITSLKRRVKKLEQKNKVKNS
ncbi:putative ribonuclease H-like domain-containing protein [Tanacetum coccineum]